MEDGSDLSKTLDPANYDKNSATDMARLQFRIYTVMERVRQEGVDAVDADCIVTLTDDDVLWPIVQTVVPEFRSPFPAEQ